MKVLKWPGFTMMRRDAATGTSRLAWLIDILARGATPVDGVAEPKEKPSPRRNPEPVRWGNFR
jgi:hypothetical protein